MSSTFTTAHLDALWATAMEALAEEQGNPVDSDDVGMREVSEEELTMWADDLEDRVGLSVPKFRAAALAFSAARDAMVSQL